MQISAFWPLLNIIDISRTSEHCSIEITSPSLQKHNFTLIKLSTFFVTKLLSKIQVSFDRIFNPKAIK